MEKITATTIANLNSRKEPLSIEVLKTFTGFENHSEEELTKIVFFIQRFSGILCEMTGIQKEKKLLIKPTAK